MDKLNEWKELALKSLTSMGEKLSTGFLDVLGAILILILGWLVTKIVVMILKKALKFFKVETLSEKINDMKLFGQTDLKISITKIIVSFVKWFMFLIFLIIAADILKWDVVSKEVSRILNYLPNLFSAIALFMIGMYVAGFIRKAILGLFESFDLTGSRIISSLAYYIIIALVTVTALNQAGIDTSIINNNLTIILGVFLIAMGLAFGLGSKDIMRDLLHSFYARKSYEAGEKIKFDDVEGEIESIDNLSATVKTKKGKTVIPIKEFVTNRVEKTTAAKKSAKSNEV